MTNPAAKRCLRLLPAPVPHWVGDGFPVRTLFSAHAQDAAAISPFLLLDYAGPHRFAPDPSGRPRGVDAHPHRGFETVTIVYQGELEHRDSAGHSGRIGPGDVQWMTAAAGVLHEEKHSARFTRQGGTLEMVQLWVNLPANLKMTPPHYQELSGAMIPQTALPNRAGSARIIAGKFQEHRGPARTHTPLNLWDLRLQVDGRVDLPLPPSHNTIALLLAGGATLAGATMQAPQGVLLSREGEYVPVQAGPDGAALLLLSGQPIDEPVVAQGPFVMNTPEQIRQAIDDYRNGRMGVLDA